MRKDLWQKIEELFEQAILLAPAERREFVEEVCSGDEELRAELLELIEADRTESYFLDEDVYTLGLAVLKDEEILLPDTEFAFYKIKKLLGRGGMGAVYLAEDTRLERLVALKLLPVSLGASAEEVQRFQQEARTASAISHPNVAHIYEFGEAGENARYFLAMEYVEGRTLRKLLETKKIGLHEALKITLQIAEALVATHTRSIVHRDIKPENVMVTETELVKVLDFGVAKLLDSHPPNGFSISSKVSLVQTTPGMVMGTIGYISPEQLQNKRVDFRSDIWSAGVCLYEMLVGQKPFEGKTPQEISKAILKKKPLPFSLDDVSEKEETMLKNIISKMLAKPAAKRYQSANELANDLRELKKKLEFSRQLYTVESIDERVFTNDFNPFEQTRNSSFINKSKQLWKQQSLWVKVLQMAAIGIFTFATSVSIQYFSPFFVNKLPKFESFSPDSRNRMQISTLFGVRKKLESSIPVVSFSPDGNSISFVLSAEDKNDIYIKPLNQDAPTRITDGKWIYQTPVWSPDGQQIAFVSNRDNKNAIWMISPQGGTPVLRTNLEINFVSCQLLKWSNDTKRLFFQSGRTLKTIELDSGLIEEIKFPVENVGTAFSLSADESLVAFVSAIGENRKLWIYNLKTGELTDITSESNLTLFPVILPDNKRVVFSSNQNGNSQLYIEDFINKNPNQITFGDSNAFGPVVSPDGNRIVYVSENNVANIFALNISSKKEVRLTEEIKMQLFPDVSKDLTKMIFQVTDEYSNFTKSPLKVKNLQTGDESVLDNQDGFWAKWSPAGEDIAFLRHEGRNFNIWKTEFPDNQSKQLTSAGISFGGYMTAPFNMTVIPFDWSPDGRKIAFVSKQSGGENVWVIDSNGANPQMLTDNNDPKISYNSAIWSPDGNKIAFNRLIQTEPNRFQYNVSLISNNQVKQLFQNDRDMRLLGWNANGTNLLASVDNSNEVEIYELSETTQPKLLVKLVKADFQSLSLSPDARTIVYSSGRNGIYNIFSYSIKGKEKQLTDNKEDTILFSGISWSPAGDRIFYSKQSGEVQISMISDKPESSE